MVKASLDTLPVFSKRNLPSPPFDYTSGAVFLIDKPASWTSFDMVKYLRKALDGVKVGHAGTLDPMATGLLVLCCGRATKVVTEIQGQPKEYIGDITLGASTPSHDAETEPDRTVPWQHISKEMVSEALEKSFTGTIWQVPPMYSALKHKGRRLYKLARKGEQVERQPREVTIHEIILLEFAPPRLKLYVKCGKGTYIRSIASDLGRALDSLGYLSGLRRTAIGRYRVEEALSVNELKELKF